MSGIDQIITPYKGDPNKRFEFIKFIGKGSYGFVELCKDHENGDKLVCKKIARFIETTEAEILALYRSKHKHIIKFYDYYETILDQDMINRCVTIGLPVNTKMYGLIIEYGEGGHLGNYMSQRKSIEEIILIKFLDQTIQALQYLNQNKNMHRDIKPENILLDKFGDIKLADFGTIFQLAKDDTHKNFTNVQGTGMYISPEIYLSHNYGNKYSYPVDIFSLGVSIYQACNNDMSEDYLKDLYLIDHPDPIPNPYSSQFNDLIMNMLTLDPDKRANIPYIQEVLNQIATPKELNENEQSLLDTSLNLFYGIDGVVSKAKAIQLFEKLIKITEFECPEPVYQLAQCYLYGDTKEKNIEKAINLLRVAARKRYTPALKLLSYCYQNAIGVEKDMFTAIQLLTIAQRDDPEASFLLGCLYYNSNVLEIESIKEESKTSVKRDYDLAFYYFSQAKDFVPAQNYLGLCYLHGNSTKTDIFEAYKYLSLSANGGSIDGMYNLAEFYLTQKPNDPFYTEKAIDLLIEAANQYHLGASFKLNQFCNKETPDSLIEKISLHYSKINSAGPNSEDSMYSFALLKLNCNKGVEQNVYEAFSRLSICKEHHPGAAYHLAKCYKDGIGTQRDVNKAADLFEEASKNGIPDAIGDLALCLLKGEGHPVDKEKAFQLLTESSDLGSPQLAYRLAQCYLTGDSVATDKAKALSLFRIAHSRGYIEATYQLAHCLHTGEGINPEEFNCDTLQEARDLFEIAAAKKHVEASYELGMIYNQDQEVFANKQKAFSLFEVASNQNHPRATTELGILYETGAGTKKDLQQAFKLYNKSSNLGEINGIYHLGMCYLKGIGTNINCEKARSLFEKASLADIADAKTQLGIMYQNEIGGPRDIFKAAKFFQEAANQGNTEAKVQLGHCYLDGKGVAMDYIKAFHLFKETQKTDNVEGLFKLGLLYKKGIGTRKNINEAIEIFKNLIARKNHVPSMFELGSIYIKEMESEEQLRVAVDLLNSAVKGGNADAMNLLGCCYLQGNGVDINVDKAVYYFREASKAGNTLGKVNLAQCYIEGKGVPLDQEKGYKLLKEAPQDDPSAKFRIGVCLYKGAGVKGDKQEGIKLLKEAASQGDLDALCYYGKLLLVGKDVEMNKEAAFSYFKIASQKGHPESKYQLGVFYENGDLDDVEKNDIQAQSLYQQSSDAGFPKASYRLGMILLNNPLQKLEGIKLLEKAASLKNIDAIKELARIYKEGDGVPVDSDKADDYQNMINQINHSDFITNMLRSNFTPQPRVRSKKRGFKSLFPNLFDSK